MEEINLDSLDLNPSVDFGGGIELLMNDKKAKSQGQNQNSISLEDELKELDSFDINEKDSGFKFKKEIPIARETTNLDTNNPSIFKHIDDINVEKEGPKVEKMTKEDLLREKFIYLKKLEALETKGITLSKRYSMDSSLDEMKGEYEFIIAEKEKKNSVQFQAKVLTTLITGLEFLNGKFDPFDIKLDGWSEQIHENIEDYDEIFSELHEKYKSKAKMAPEIKFLFQLAASGMMIHMTNTMFKSSIPGMDDIMRQNPDLMSQFTKAAVSSMENTTPGLGNFMNDFRREPKQAPRQNQSQNQYQGQSQFFERQGPSSGLSFERPERQERQEMKGPGTENINTILNGLKKINVDNDSTISAEEIDLMSTNTNSTSRRKRRSDKNTISLNL
jgi:hypothetical protein